MTFRKKRKILVIAIFVFLCFIVFSIYLLKVFKYQKTVQDFTYSDIVIEDIADGTYIGECNVDFIYVKAAVTIENGVITQIKLLEHKNERGTSAEKITDDIVRYQSIDVDAISGATNSSKVIKKAVEDALMKSAG